MVTAMSKFYSYIYFLIYFRIFLFTFNHQNISVQVIGVRENLVPNPLHSHQQKKKKKKTKKKHICQGHEYWDLLSLRDGMHVCTE